MLCSDVALTTAGPVRLANPRQSVYKTCCGEVRCLNVLHQGLDTAIGLINQCQTGVEYLAQVMGRNIGGHTHRNTCTAVNQQVRNFSRKYFRDFFSAVVVRHVINRVLIQIRQQLMRNTLHANLGVSHGSGSVTIDRAKVALTINQGITQAEVLCHTNNGVVNRTVAVWVIFTDHVTHDTSGLFVRTIPIVAELVHRIQNTAVHRLEAITHVRQGPAHNDAHCIIQIALFQLFFDINRLNFAAVVAHVFPFLNT